eukprot:COSAG05_NODE_4479_length_1495_cov_3.893983_2_plen_145_part_00
MLLVLVRLRNGGASRLDQYVARGGGEGGCRVCHKDPRWHILTEGVVSFSPSESESSESLSSGEPGFSSFFFSAESEGSGACFLSSRGRVRASSASSSPFCFFFPFRVFAEFPVGTDSACGGVDFYIAGGDEDSSDSGGHYRKYL